MPQPSLKALALAERYHLGLRTAPTFASGAGSMSNTDGASVEFSDHRDYLPGDEVRHIDWRAYARSDRLMIKRWRKETRPYLDLLIDVSASMAVHESKASMAVDLAALLTRSALADGMAVRVLQIAERPERISAEHLAGEGLEFNGRVPLTQTLPGALLQLRGGAVVMLISDFLFPHDAGPMIRSLAARSSNLALVQVLSKDDAEPEAGTALRLQDAENDTFVDVVLDKSALTRYQRRLSALTDGLRDECRRVGGRFVSIRSDRDLEKQCNEELLGAGILAME